MRSAATRAALSVFAVLGCALTFLLQPALLTPGGDLQAEADDSDIAVYNYDSLAASTTASANAQSGALRAYDAAAQLSRSSTAAPASALAARGLRGVRPGGSGARYPLHPKIQGQLGTRGWTTGQIDEAIQSGQQVRAANKATGNPATRHIHPTTGQSVVVDDVTGQVIHVGGPGFKYGPGSGDVP